MSEMSENLHENFTNYANFGVSSKQQSLSSSSGGQGPVLNSKNLTKWLKDAGVFGSKKVPGITSNDTDIVMNKVIGKRGGGGPKGLLESDMKEFLTQLGKDVSGRSKGAATESQVRHFVYERLVSASAPSLAGSTKQSAAGAVDRLTDVKGYTGAHRERFDQDTGRGKGKEGREYVDDHASKGYVKGYKRDGTYDKK